MKVVVLIAILLGIFAIGFAVKRADANREAEVVQGWAAVDEQQAQTLRRLDADLVEASARLLDLRHGEATGELYRHCHASPPTTKAHQLECKRLDEQVAREDARDDAERKANEAKHPW